MSAIGDDAAVAGGMAILIVALVDVFQTVIVPRAEDTFFRVSRYATRALWRLWPPLARAIYPGNADAREDLLGTYAPFALMFQLALWVGMLLWGWGLLFYGLRAQLHPPNISFGSAVYFAGTSLMTIGYGDIVPVTMLTRAFAIVTAASGLGVVAIVISFLFAVFGAFQRRETFVVTIGARAGAPPSGVGLLAVHAGAGILSDLAEVFRQAQTWTAEVMESHLAYPILIYFRSSHDYESWVGTLGTVLDAAALVISTLDSESMENAQTQGQARILYELGRHLVVDFTAYFRLGTHEGAVGVERGEFDAACDHLQKKGYRIRDRDAGWTEFARLRSTYAEALNAMARWLEIPPVQWVGDRSLIHPHH